MLENSVEQRAIRFECRDIGYGVESGIAVGVWGERDWTGKRAFHVSELDPCEYDGLGDVEPVFYFFDDEVLSDEVAR